ncbi:hypothetical protein BG000_002324 [Podila horticola]|nr:hypothetical protein BG000_002324 [Podila horticola]
MGAYSRKFKNIKVYSHSFSPHDPKGAMSQGGTHEYKSGNWAKAALGTVRKGAWNELQISSRATTIPSPTWTGKSGPMCSEPSVLCMAVPCACALCTTKSSVMAIAMGVVDRCLRHIDMPFEEHRMRIDRTFAILVTAHPEIGKLFKGQEIPHAERRKVLIEELGVKIAPDPAYKESSL